MTSLPALDRAARLPRPATFAAALAGAAAAAALLSAAPASAATAQARHCLAEAHTRHIPAGEQTRLFLTECERGLQAPRRNLRDVPRSAGGKAVVEPSGQNVVARDRACNAEADRKKFTGAARKQFELSCLATAGPTTESQTQLTTPKPSGAIKNIGINNYDRPANAPAPRPPNSQPATLDKQPH